MNKDFLLYSLIRICTFPLSWMPYTWIHAIGNKIGLICYYFMREYRKRTFSNLALANDLKLSEKELIALAKQSFQNLAINCLEYPRFAREKNLKDVIQCENPEIAETLYQKGQGIIFFCGHQSNWEVLFLDGTKRMQGIAIGKSIKNKILYRWILSIREKNGGKIIAPRNAVREGLRALKKGVFIGIVGDQGMPDSNYSFPFLGRRAWSTTAPALLAYKTNSPIIFAETRRVKGGYRIRYSDPIWPSLSSSMEEEVVRMMNQVLTLLEKSIKKSPGEWLWQHNRWKQQTPQIVYKRFRHDSIAIVLPKEETLLQKILPHLGTLKEIYPANFLFLIVPKGVKMETKIEVEEILYYEKMEETLLPDYRFKLVLNFTDYQPIERHYQALSAFEVLNLKTLQELAKPHLCPSMDSDLSQILKRALCRPGSLWHPEKPYVC